MTERTPRDRFTESAEIMAAAAARAVPELVERLRNFCVLTGDERALDAGTGAGTFALALAPSVGEVVGLDPEPELLAEARRLAAGVDNVSFVEGDAAALPFESRELQPGRVRANAAPCPAARARGRRADPRHPAGRRAAPRGSARLARPARRVGARPARAACATPRTSERSLTRTSEDCSKRTRSSSAARRSTERNETSDASSTSRPAKARRERPCSPKPSGSSSAASGSGLRYAARTAATR